MRTLLLVGVLAAGVLWACASAGTGDPLPDLPVPGIAAGRDIECAATQRAPALIAGTEVRITDLSCGTALEAGGGGVAEPAIAGGGLIVRASIEARSAGPKSRSPEVALVCSNATRVAANPFASRQSYKPGVDLEAAATEAGSLVFAVPGDCGGARLIALLGQEQVTLAELAPRRPG